MLTLDELKEAVARWSTGDWPIQLNAARKISAFARDYIAREQLLDTPLTAEICERLGPQVLANSTQHVYYEWVTDYSGFSVRIEQGQIRINGRLVENPTIRHLLAAACLAGVTVDLDKLKGE